MTTYRVSPDQPSMIIDPISIRRRQMVKQLKATADEYVRKERDRLNAEARALQSILDGRAAGAGIQQLNTEMIAGVAQSSLDAFLSPKGA